MHRFSAAMLLRFGLAVAVVMAVGGRAAVAQQGEVAVATRGPRFLFAPTPAKTPPVPVDIHRNELLRKVVSLNFERPTIRQVLVAIEHQASLKFFYSREVLNVDRPVSLRADSITVAAALMAILVDTGVDVLLSQRMQIALVKRSGSQNLWQGGSIAGRVTDSASGYGVKRADVILEGTSWRTETDTMGSYRLSNIESGSYTLTVRRPGYRKWNRRVTVEEAKTDTVDVVLGSQAIKLDELVTTATGQQRRRDLGNAITTIRADSVLRSAPIRNLTDLLQNRVPGLTVQHTSGAPGDPARLRLRGLGSVLRSNDPVVIVDGVRIYAVQAERRSGNLVNIGRITDGTVSGFDQSNLPRDQPAPSPLDQIDPNTIEKIEILKGPSAATLYGADAANGVIVITTKKGKPGPTRWNAIATRGLESTLGRYSEGYYRWGHSPFDNISMFCPVSDAQCIQDSLSRFQALNQPNLTLLGQGPSTTLSLTASGGTQALTYSVTGSYSNEIGLVKMPDFEVDRFRTLYSREAPDWMRRPHSYEKWSVSSNVSARLSSAADLMLTTTLGRSEQQRSTLERQVAKLAATYVDTINGVYYVPASGSGTALNVSSSYLSGFYTKTTASTVNLTTSLGANWHPRSWFTATSQAGLNVIPREDQLSIPPGLLPAIGDSGVLARGTGRSLISTFNLYGELRRPLPAGFMFLTSVGVDMTTTNTDDLSVTALGLVPGASTIAGARVVNAAESRVNTSIFGWHIEPRITGSTLSFSTGIRLDGGSAYGGRVSAAGGGLFKNLLSLPKFNGSWTISEEPWFPFTSLFSSLRLRGAYGQAQVQPGPADRLRLYGFTTVGNVATSNVTLTTLGNSQLRPERSKEIEGGFDADLLDSRITVVFTMYRKTKIDALMNTRVPLSVNGGSSVIQNIGNIRNTGLNLSFDFTPLRSAMLDWNLALSYSRNNNVLTELGPGVIPNPSLGLVAGYPLNGRWARPILGYADANENGVLDANEVIVGDSAEFMGRTLPLDQTSLFTNLALFGGAVGITAGFSYESGWTQVNKGQSWVLSRGRGDPTASLGEQAGLVAAYDNTPGNQTDYGLIQDVSTFRFNSLSVSYTVPQVVARLLRAEQLTIAAQGSNLGLHSTYGGKDPDVTAWSAGENITDDGQIPQPRRWLVRVELKY